MRLDERIGIRSTNINLIKFVCALAVIFSHSFAVAQNRDDVLASFNGGQCNIGGVAVAVFFFLSGLYVTKSLSKETSMKTFMWKRCKRIFPQLWIVVLACVLVLGPVVNAIYNKMPGIVSYVTSPSTYLYLLNGLLIPVHNLPGVFESNYYQTVNGPLWTMPVEFAAYIALAIIGVITMAISKNNLVKSQRISRILHMCSFVFLTVCVIGLNFIGNTGMIMSVVRPLAIFFEGCLFYDYKDKLPLNWMIGVIGLIVLAVLCKTPFFNVGLVLIFPYAIASIGLGTRQIGKLPTFVDSSYEMYLCGWPIQQIVLLLFGGVMAPWLNFMLTIPFDVILGWGLLELTERMNDRNKSKK